MPESRRSRPDGLEDGPVRRASVFHRHASPISLVILGGLLVAALAGAFGGGHAPISVAETDAAKLVVATPGIARNGEFYETRITITPKRPVKDLVLAVSPSLWRDITQNAMIPQASDEKFEDGLYRFSYGAAKTGEAVHVQMDFQINPALFGANHGTVSVFDGDRLLARMPVSMKVRP
jgi:hypothetical protein